MTRPAASDLVGLGSAGVVRRLVGRLWARANARLGIVATADESAYYAWADEYLDRLAQEERISGTQTYVLPG